MRTHCLNSLTVYFTDKKSKEVSIFMAHIFSPDEYVNTNNIMVDFKESQYARGEGTKRNIDKYLLF